MPSKPKEYCGLCGISGPEGQMEQLHMGLHSLQHRGQESAGAMTVIDGKCEIIKDSGLVDQVFEKIPRSWWEKPIKRAISHVRYSTAGGTGSHNAQPLMVDMGGHNVGVAHNGTITNATSLRRELQEQGAIFQTTTDTELVLHLMSRSLNTQDDGDILKALERAVKRLQGAFCLLVLTDDMMVAVRDSYGFRPLCFGDFEDGTYMVASETIALSVTGARYIRDVKPGEMIWWKGPGNKMSSRIFAEAPRKAQCIFEHVYFARPGSYVFGDSVYEVRKEMGRQLAREAPIEADVIVPVPDSGIYAALGYAEEIGIPLDMGLSRNHYVGRTFIDPGLISRGQLVRRKLQPIAEALKGKRVCLIEDSIVRGSTSRARVQTLREVGVKEVHMRVSCPPHKYGCYFGIDFPQREKLLANNVAREELCRAIRLDSLEYLSRDGMLSCVNMHKPEDFCCACFDGNYPVTPELLDAPQLPKS